MFGNRHPVFLSKVPKNESLSKFFRVLSSIVLCTRDRGYFTFRATYIIEWSLIPRWATSHFVTLSNLPISSSKSVNCSVGAAGGLLYHALMRNGFVRGFVISSVIHSRFSLLRSSRTPPLPRFRSLRIASNPGIYISLIAKISKLLFSLINILISSIRGGKGKTAYNETTTKISFVNRHTGFSGVWIWIWLTWINIRLTHGRIYLFLCWGWLFSWELFASFINMSPSWYSGD